MQEIARTRRSTDAEDREQVRTELLHDRLENETRDTESLQEHTQQRIHSAAVIRISLLNVTLQVLSKDIDITLLLITLLTFSRTPITLLA